MDVGSGGGSPAFRWRWRSVQVRLTMVEVKARKSAFLREAVRQLGLDGRAVETSRYEELLASLSCTSGSMCCRCAPSGSRPRC